MRRKVIQEYVNHFCQKVIDLPAGYDLASFAHYGSGIYWADLLTGSCSHNGNPILRLRLCDEYRQWIKNQLERHGIQEAEILEATIRIKVRMEGLSTRASFGHSFASGHFSFECESLIKTDEKSYLGQMQGEKEWSFDWYYEKLYGSLPDAWPPSV
jgi:hypothetical protein